MDWYEKLPSLPWKAIGERALVVVAMSTRWRPQNTHVPLYLDGDTDGDVGKFSRLYD
ncbi:hypothetical protein Hanom_Chr08g00722181 [Helianthus anomalus]